MNQYLKTIQDLLQQKQLTEHDIEALLKALADADKQWNITDFKLDRTEKVKKTTAILLEETIAELELKRKAVEEQNHELEIETALERVRAVAMGMKKPEDMLEVNKTIAQQLELLKVKEIRNVQTGIFYEEKKSYTNYEFYAKHDKVFITEVNYDSHPVGQAFANQMLKGPNEVFIHSFTGKEVKEWLDHQRTTNVFIDSFLETADSLNYYWYSLGPVAMGVSTYVPLREEEINLFKRFRNVFELAYRRYQDIEKAEAQARESQIQLALERVRARTMAMQRSDELPETSYLLFQQFRALGANAEQMSIGIINEADKLVEISATIHGSQLPQIVKVDLDEPVVMKQVYPAWRRNERSLVIDLSGKKLKEYNDYRGKLSGIKFDSKDDDRWVINAAFFSKGLLSFSTHEPCAAETIQLLERFAGVFDLTYTRFLDLKQAETQARESQIQLALERVRARTMAMQKSEELKETTLVLFQQFKELGLPTAQVSICIFDEELKYGEMFLTLKGEKIDRSFKMELDKEVFVMQKIKTSFLNKEKTFSITITGKLLKDYNQWRNVFVGEKKYDESKTILKQSWYVNAAMFSGGMMGISSDTPPSEESLKLLERFVNVFDLTFTRFLDLQKAEAQAREAQIEASLERVRSRAMAMQTSEELNSLIGTVFTELTKLDLTLTRCVIIIYDPLTNDAHWWMANSEAPDAPVDFFVQYADFPFFNAYLKAWNERALKWVHILEGNAKTTLDDFLFSKTELSRLPAFVIEGMRGPERVYINASFNNFGNLTLASLSPLSDEHFDVLLRFAKVFDLTYTRFNDLKQAEFNAREAQIELALERVRAKTMAMHNSTDVADTVATMFDELVKLGIDTIRCGIAIIHDTRQMEVWTANSGEHGRAGLTIGSLGTNIHPMLEEVYVGWKTKVSTTSYELMGEDLKNYFRAINNAPNYPIRYDIDALPYKQFNSAFYFPEGALFAFAKESIPAESSNILKRFASVFGQTYRRYLDLQKAEAQAREAQIEAAVEKVRARTMGMQHSDELKHAAALLFQQVKTLGVPAYSCGYNIWEMNERVFTSWMSTQDGSDFNSVTNIPLTEDANFIRFGESRRKGEQFFVLELRGERMQEHYRYLKTIPAFKAYFDYAIKMGHVIPETQIHHIANFSQGNLLFITLEPCPEYHDVFKRFAAVFEQTYTRFLDLQKAELQAREAQIELALERVRARTMSMHKSEELPETAEVLYHQLKELGDNPERMTIGILNEESRTITWWATDQGGAKIDFRFQAGIDERTVMAKLYTCWKARQKSIVIELTGQDLSDWVKYCTQVMLVPIDENILQKRRVQTASTFSHGWLMITSPHHSTPETVNILERFATVFSLTYRRFLDLQKAEAQAREAQIEAALERVRSRSLAMHKSDELSAIAKAMFEQLRNLGLELEDGLIIMLFKENSHDQLQWPVLEGAEMNRMFLVPYFDHPVMNEVYKAREAGVKFIERHFDKTVKDDFLKKIFSITDYKDVPVEFQNKDFAGSCYHYSFAMERFTGILMHSYNRESYPAEYNEILRKFARVFEQAYVRFLDLQKAEAQAKEAQIEASLEKVRAQALGMRKAGDLLNICQAVYKELIALGFDEIRNAMIHTFNDELEFFMDYDYSDLLKGTATKMPYRGNPVIEDFLSQIRGSENAFAEITVQGKELAAWRKYRKSSGQPDDPRLETTSAVCYYIYSVGQASIGISTFGEIADEKKQLLKRFRNVFDFAYRRYIDVATAEAQSREAQIELSLERVRAKTMAMHNSQDVGETVMVMFDEFIKLGIETYRCGILIGDKDNHMEVWTAKSSNDHKVDMIIGLLDMNIHPLLQGIYNSWSNKEPVYTYELEGGDVKDYYTAINNFKDYPVRFNLDLLPPRQSFTDFFFPEGVIFAFTANPLAIDVIQIFKRFAAVFGQTYRRYLDLKKAEMQAREAQIEAALERVRGRTMAMHSSEDVAATTITMFTELQKLGFENVRCGISIINKDHIMEVWSISSMPDGTMVRGVGKLDMNAHPLWRDLYERWHNKEEFFLSLLAGKEKEDYLKILNSNNSYLSKPILEMPDFHVQGCFFNEGVVWTYSLEPANEEQKQILKRFTAVFSLTFRRYQDLKKAEANAREATIEAALERVRGKAMAMHDSNDLSSAASMVFTELRRLNITSIRCGVGLLSKDTTRAQLYSATSSPESGDSLSLIGWIELSNHPVAQKIYSTWMKGEDYFPVLNGEELNSYYTNLLSGLSLPSVPDWATGEKQYGSFLPFSVGCLYVWSEKPYGEDEIRILKRFATIIDLTFRRYMELQQSEANARDAVKQAALDRVRADIASMRTVSDLDRITPLIWNELTILGIPFIRCGVFIMDDSQQLIHTFLSTPDGKAIAAFHIPYEATRNIKDVVSHWRDKKNYIDHWDETAFTEFAMMMAAQGGLSSPEQYLKTIPKGGFYLHFLPFLQGMLYVGNITQLGEEATTLIQHVADAFSTAYARYEDFNKLEAAKQQVDKTLVDLRQAQQQLVQSEKMASLGELTAGIAHEIQNPLNFVNNFSDVSNELLEEMKTELNKGNKEDAMAIAEDVKQNLAKILHHGKRADAIVKGMLQHSRSSSGQKELTDINNLADEYLRLAYHGLRAKDKSFNATFETDFDNSIPKVDIMPQEIGRVILNLINNAFYAVSQRQKGESSKYKPTVIVTTKKTGDRVLIAVKDNGGGIPAKILDKIFQPFFTTKPTGQGTGLGLSLAYDIVTKGHGGELKVETKEGEGSQFIILLPNHSYQ